MADVAQLVERQIVALNVAGSSPVIRPKKKQGNHFPCFFLFANFHKLILQFLNQTLFMF